MKGYLWLYVIVSCCFFFFHEEKSSSMARMHQNQSQKVEISKFSQGTPLLHGLLQRYAAFNGTLAFLELNSLGRTLPEVPSQDTIIASIFFTCIHMYTTPYYLWILFYSQLNCSFLNNLFDHAPSWLLPRESGCTLTLWIIRWQLSVTKVHYPWTLPWNYIHKNQAST